MAKVIESSAYRLEPHKIPFYLYELSTLFHSYWSKEMKIINLDLYRIKIKKEDSIVFIYLIAIVIKNGMNILEFHFRENVMFIKVLNTIMIY